MPLVSRTRATLRSAEFGFFGVTVRTCVQTPRFCGEPLPREVRFVSALKVKRSAGALVFLVTFVRPFRTSWLIVGNAPAPASHNDRSNAYISEPVRRGIARAFHMRRTVIALRRPTV